MRQTIKGLVAAIAVVTASAVPALACGGGLFTSCSPCGQEEYVSPCAAPVYVAPAPAYGCDTGCGWAHERLPDPVHQYYYVNQGPTYSGPGDFAPVPTYQEDAVSGWSGYRHHRYHYGYGVGVEGPPMYGYRSHPHFRSWHHGYRYGYAPRGYAPHFYGPRHSMRYGARMGMPRMYGHREMHENMMRRYH
jgi:hypothetical protein